MLSSISVPDSIQRPRGVTVLAFSLAVVSASCVAFAVLVLLGSVPLSYGATLLGGGLEQLGPLALVLYGFLCVLLAWALWRGWRWSARIAIVLAAAGIAFAVPAVSSAVVDGRIGSVVREGLQIVVRVVVIYYLVQPQVKEWFAR